MSKRVVFHNPISGETLVHRDQPDGTHDLFYGIEGDDGGNHNHAAFDLNGNVEYLRENGIVKANKKDFGY